MVKNILECLENTEKKYPEKLAFVDNKVSITYGDFVKHAQKIGSSLVNAIQKQNQPVAIFLDKNVSCLEAMFGTLYSGNFYTVLDVKSPRERINCILNTLEPCAIITDQKNLERAKELGIDKTIYLYEEMLTNEINKEVLDSIRSRMIDTDPMYVLFTSGSTGVPKGTVLSHKAVISYTTWVVQTFHINQDTIWGSQTPFYFSMSITDVFSTIVTGATLYIIPKMYFSFPVKLLNFMNENKINSIYWVPSALCIVANLKALDEVPLTTLQKVLFAGEVMPTKQLNIWMEHLPDVMFANLFGPTETTDICTYYVVDRKFSNEENIPIGKACNNCDVMIIKEDGTLASQGEEGELCARGSFLAMGYYNNPEKTASVFVQNPINKYYPEIIYRTGDIVKYNEQGEIIYLSRKDFQIKHMGYRIELGEIETAVNNIDGIIICACVYDTDSSRIGLFYQGETLSEEEVLKKASEKLPNYMCPNDVTKLDRMPYNANGKIDRVALKNIYKKEN